MPVASVATVKVSLDLRTPLAKYPIAVLVPWVPLSVIVATAAPSSPFELIPPTVKLVPAQTITSVEPVSLISTQVAVPVYGTVRGF